MLYNIRYRIARARYGATGKTTRLLVRRIPLDDIGWRALGVLFAGILLALAVQAGIAYMQRPRFHPLEARPLSVKQAPIVIFQTVQVPAPTPPPLPTPQPEIVYIETVVEVPVIAPAVVQEIAPVAEPAAPAVQDGGGNIAPAGCPFPIVNGACGNGVPAQSVPDESAEGVKVNARRLPPKGE